MNRKTKRYIRASLLCIAGRLLLFVCLFSSSKSLAQAGTLDNTFGTNGVVTLLVDTSSNAGSRLTIKPDGKIVMVGYSGQLDLICLNPDGTKDLTFGNNGVVTNIKHTFGWDVAQQTDGKLVATGSGHQPFGNSYFATSRYFSNGVIDSSFGTNGTATLSISDGADNSRRLTIQPDGKIIVAGESAFSSTNGLVMVRYDQSGNLDNTFGVNGIVTTSVVVSDPSYPGFTDMALQPDGKILLGMLYKNNLFYFGVIRYNLDGSIDNSFGTNGMVTGTTISSPAIQLQPDGKIILQGSGTGPQGYLIRLNSNGTYDPTFGTNGLSVPTPSLRPGQALYQPDGRILDCGWVGSAGIGTVVVTRYYSNGTVDNSFGNNGITQTDIMPGIDKPHCMAMQSDGKILICGEASDPNAGKSYFFVARYLGLQDGIKEFDKLNLEISVYPNPFEDKLRIGLSDAKLPRVTILNTLSEVVYECESNCETIDLSMLPSGVYILRTIQGQQIYSRRIIKR